MVSSRKSRIEVMDTSLAWRCLRLGSGEYLEYLGVGMLVEGSASFGPECVPVPRGGATESPPALNHRSSRTEAMVGRRTGSSLIMLKTRFRSTNNRNNTHILKTEVKI